jgi:Copper type II ascorbate-dependent monooxygenase, C-terminal domain
MKLKSILILSSFSMFAITACEKPIEYNVADIPENFTPLAAPKTGEGFQIHLPPFPIPANFEREFFCRMPLNNPEEFLATGFEAKMRPGSHHMLLYNFEDPNDPLIPKIGVIRDQNMPNGNLNPFSVLTTEFPLFQALSAEFRFDLPPGYAFKVPKNASFDMNPHYFNKTDETRFGEVYANIYQKPDVAVDHLCDVLYSQPEELSIKPKATTEVVTDYKYEKETHFVTITSHYHKRGKKFKVNIIGGPRDGEEIYYSEDYEHPLWKTFQPELILQPGEGLRTTATYVNETDRTIPFGVTSEDEMNIMISFQYDK